MSADLPKRLVQLEERHLECLAELERLKSEREKLSDEASRALKNTSWGAQRVAITDARTGFGEGVVAGAIVCFTMIVCLFLAVVGLGFLIPRG